VDQPDVRSDCWVHPALDVRRSPIHDRGLFARDPIRTGTVVVELGGRLVTTAELMALVAGSTVYIDSVTVEDDVHLVLPPNTAVHFANHSCEPNLAVIDRYLFATKRPIAADEELTIDYDTISGAPGQVVSCKCGSSRCRGTVEV